MKVRRVGATFLLLAVLAGVHGLTSLWLATTRSAVLAVFALLLFLLAWLAYIVGSQVQRLEASARPRAMALASALLVLFPIGTLLGAEALFVLARNRVVFTPEAVAMLDTAPPPPRDQMGIVGRTSVLLVLAATIALFAHLAFYA